MILATLEANGDLRRYVPRSRHDPVRRLYLSKEALNDLQSPYSAANLLDLRGQIEAALTHWTLNGRVYADDEGEARFLKRLDRPPPEIWNIRVTESDVQARLFGRFIEPNTLVLTKFYPRGAFSPKLKKGKKKTPQQKAKEARKWRQAMIDCEKAWRKLFPAGELFSGNRIQDYVTENCDDFPI
jgi:hypothetical protein